MKKLLLTIATLLLMTVVFGQTKQETKLFNLLNTIRTDSSSTELEWNSDSYEKITNLIRTESGPESCSNVSLNEYLSKIFYNVNNSRTTSYYGFFILYEGGKYDDSYFLNNLQSEFSESIFTNISETCSVNKWTRKVHNKEIVFIYITFIKEIE